MVANPNNHGAHGAYPCVQAIKSLPFSQRQWDADKKVWTVDRDVLDEALEKLRAEPVHAQILQPPAVSNTLA